MLSERSHCGPLAVSKLLHPILAAVNKLNMESVRLLGPPHSCRILRPTVGPEVGAAGVGDACVLLLGGALGKGCRTNVDVWRCPFVHVCWTGRQSSLLINGFSLPTGTDCPVRASPNSNADSSTTAVSESVIEGICNLNSRSPEGEPHASALSLHGSVREHLGSASPSVTSVTGARMADWQLVSFLSTSP